MVIEYGAQRPARLRTNNPFGMDLGVLESRKDVHPRFTVNWAALATVVFTALIFLLFGIGIGASLVMQAIVDKATIDDSSLNMGPLPACVEEDSVGCYWDAEVMGNGLGSDVVGAR